MTLEDKKERGECPVCECKHSDEHYWLRYTDVKEALKKLKPYVAKYVLIEIFGDGLVE